MRQLSRWFSLWLAVHHWYLLRSWTTSFAFLQVLPTAYTCSSGRHIILGNPCLIIFFVASSFPIMNLLSFNKVLFPANMHLLLRDMWLLWHTLRFTAIWDVARSPLGLDSSNTISTILFRFPSRHFSSKICCPSRECFQNVSLASEFMNLFQVCLLCGSTS